MNNQKYIFIFVGIAILASGVGFLTGTIYQQWRVASRKMTPNGQFLGRDNDRNGMMNFRNGRVTGFRPLVGEILSKDSNSITVKIPDGSSRIVFYNTSTNINRADKVDASALASGQIVRVFGIINSDGSVSAQDIQLTPQQIQVNPGQ